VKKPAIIILCILAVVAAAVVWRKTHAGDAKAPDEKADAAKPADEESAGPTMEHDTNGNVVIVISDEMQGDIGLKVASPAAAQFSPEIKGYGRVLDPAPLCALINELASTQAAYVASSNELARLKTLQGQGNTSARALQAGEAAALHDQLAIQSARDRLALGWGAAVADLKDLPTFVQSLASLNTALVRIDLPAGQTLPAPPLGARITTLSGQSAAAEFLGPASNVDPQTQGRGLIFIVKTNAARLLPNEGLTGYVQLPGEPLAGVIIPRDAVVRAEGSAWVYVLGGNAESYTRTQIPLDHPADAGWFITNGVTTSNYVVITGAQTLLSQESKAALKPD
jgi:hypothetical protein